MSTENEFTLATITDEMQSAITHMAQMRNALIAFTKEVLVKDQDYGVIAGVSKPTLLKPGAEKLMNLYQLTVELEATDKHLLLEEQFIAYTYKATVKNRDGRVLAQCEGSANSFESKYRYVWAERPKPSQADQDRLKASGTGKFRKGADRWLWVERIENPEIIGNQNTLQKMAQKRAFVGAILLATNASEFFTQDVEDMGFINIDGTVVDEKKPTPKVAEAVPANQESQVSKKHEPVEGIPADVHYAIDSAKDVAALYLIHKGNPTLQGNEAFIKKLSTKKAEIRKGVKA